MGTKTVETLRMIQDLSPPGPGAYVGSGLEETDLEGGWVNPTHARWLHREGLVADDFRAGPMSLTEKGRILLREDGPTPPA